MRRLFYYNNINQVFLLSMPLFCCCCCNNRRHPHHHHHHHHHHDERYHPSFKKHPNNNSIMATSTATATTTAPIPDLELGEESPLLSQQNGLDDEEVLKELKKSSRAEKAVAGISTISFGASVAAMLLESNPVVYVSGIIGVIVSPYAAVQQTKITQVKALDQTNERLSEEVDQLKGENVRLTTQVADLTKTVDGLKVTKDKLKTLQSVQGLSLDQLENQLEESKKILQKMNQNLVGDLLGNLIDVAMACDSDGDMELDDDEIKHLLDKLESLNGVEIDEDKVKKMIIDSGRHIEGILELVKNLLSKDIPEEQKFYHIKQIKKNP